MKKREAGRGPGVNIGTASLVMVFSVLCLTVFAVLALLTARSELKLSRSLADSIDRYYEADGRAVEIVNLLAEGAQLPEVTVTGDGDESVYSFTVGIDAHRQLNVLLDAEYRIISWQADSVSDWTPDAGMDLWIGS